MIYLERAFSQHFTPDELPAAVRAALGKPLRRAAALTQLAVVGAFAALPEAARSQPCALLWQSTSGPRPETLTLLNEMCHGAGEPMPYDFLATQPAIAAAQLQPLLPGLRSASHFATGQRHRRRLAPAAHTCRHLAGRRPLRPGFASSLTIGASRPSAIGYR